MRPRTSWQNKRQSLASSPSVITLIGVAAIVIQVPFFVACSTYTSETSPDVSPQELQLCGQAEKEIPGYGQPYSLPQGLIHLVVKPEPQTGSSSSSASNTTTAAAGTTASTNASSGGTNSAPTYSNVVTINNAAAAASPAGLATDFGTTPVAYTVTVDPVIVPDRKTGRIHFAHFEQNWFYAENVSIGITPDGLLSTTASQSTDETGQIISNITQTAVDLAEFSAQSTGVEAPLNFAQMMNISEGFTGAARTNAFNLIQNLKTSPPAPPDRIRYKALNIDVIFDPFDPQQVANLYSLFGDVYEPSVGNGYTKYISPFKIHVDYFTNAPTGSATNYCVINDGNEDGLLFRPLTPVTITLTQQTEQFRKEAHAYLETNQDNSKAIYQQALFDDIATANAKARLDYDNAHVDFYNKEIAQDMTVKATNSTDNQVLLNQMERAQTNIDFIETNDIPRDNAAYAYASDLSTNMDLAKSTIVDLKKALTSTPTVSRTITFTKSLPNPNLVFSFNLARSAFVQNKAINLTISQGILTGVAINKPSEAEGLSEIPLNIAQQLLSLPNSLLTVRTANTTAQQNLVNSQQNLVNAQGSLQNSSLSNSVMQVTAQTALINAQAAQAQAQANLIQQQKAVQAAQSAP